MTSKLAQKLLDEEIDARLINWGYWLRSDNTYQKLNYPSREPYALSALRSKPIADIDGEWIAYVVSTLYMAGLGKSTLLAFVLKVEYVDRKKGKPLHISKRAAAVRKRFKKSCAESTYYKHLIRARRMVQLFSGPIVDK